jgi:hypothetical protein
VFIVFKLDVDSPRKSSGLPAFIISLNSLQQKKGEVSWNGTWSGARMRNSNLG